MRLERHEAPADEIPIFVISEEPKRKYNATYSGADIARMHDDLQNYRKAFVKGLRIEVKQTPQGRRPYDRFELYIDGRNVWSGEAKYIDPLNIAGGTFEAFVLQALADAKVRRT